MNSPITSRGTYVLIWLALLLLLLATYIIARFDLGALNVIAAITIAVLKMLLVILFFMHVRHSTRLTWIFVAAGFIWLAIMIDLTVSDYTTRGKIRWADAQKPTTSGQAPPSTLRGIQNKP